MRTHEKTRKRIELELARVNRAVGILKKEPRPEELEGFGDNTPLSEEVDAMIAAEDGELRAALLARLLDRAAALDEARNRLDSGSYGVCVACGEKIFQTRLMAVPEALRCTRCQEEAERVRHPEIHAHEWKRAEETFRERQKADEKEPTASQGSGNVTP